MNIIILTIIIVIVCCTCFVEDTFNVIIWLPWKRDACYIAPNLDVSSNVCLTKKRKMFNKTHYETLYRGPHTSVHPPPMSSSPSRLKTDPVALFYVFLHTF